MNDPVIDLESLALQATRLRGLARRLVADSDLAEDVVQESYLHALESRSATPRSLGAWLSGIARHVAHGMRRRREHVRALAAARERERLEPSADELAERVESQRLLASAVLSLDEPYRSTILLRFFEGLSQREIAARLGIPKATVNSRLTRALSRLRELLERRHGDRSAWIAAILPLANLPPKWMPLLVGGLLVKQKLIAATALATIATVAVVWNQTKHEERPSARESSPQQPSLQHGETAPERSLLARTADPVRSGMSVGNVTHGEACTIIVKDGETGEPVAGAEVFVLDVFEPRFDLVLGRRLHDLATSSHWDALAPIERFGRKFITRENGEARIARPGAGGAQVVARSGSNRGAGSLNRDQIGPLEIALMAQRSVAVRVIDSRGQPVAEVPVGLRIARESLVTIATSTTTGDGLARLDVAYIEPTQQEWQFGVALEFPLAESVRASLDLEHLPAEPITLVCPPVGGLRVQACNPQGKPLSEEAYVSVAAAARTDKGVETLTRPLIDGRADFQPVGLGLELEIAVKLRFDQPSVTRSVRGPKSEGEVVSVTVTVDGRLLEIGGRLVDRNHAPLSDQVWRCRLETGDRERQRGHLLKTDRAGRFRLVLADHAEHSVNGTLHLEAYSAKRLSTRAELGPSDSERIDLGDLVVTGAEPLVSGTVVDGRGIPLSRASVSLDLPEGEESDVPPESWPRGSRTDADGHFEIFGERLPSGHPIIRAHLEGPWLHDPVPISGPVQGLVLVMRAAGSLEGHIVADPGLPLDEYQLQAWPEAKGPRPSLWSCEWCLALVRPAGSFRVGNLEPGLYTVAVSKSPDDPATVFVEGVQVGFGICTDPRLQPIDLRGTTRTIRLNVRSEDGRTLNVPAYAIFEKGGIRALSNTNGPILMPAGDREVTILVDAPGHFPVSLGPAEGTKEVVLSKGREVRLRWMGEALPEPPYSLYAWLRPLQPLPPVPGGSRAASYLEAWGPHKGSFDAKGILTVRVPEPGRYKIEWAVRFYDEGFQHEVPIATAEQVLEIAGASAEPIAVTLLPGALHDALRECQKTGEEILTSRRGGG
ncbi:MAG: sigma-70 family RNA polymerase sigma factor [Planctomycetota bacterium]